MRRANRRTALLVGMVCALLVGPGVPARAEDPTPQSTSASIRYQVTFAARTCTSYTQVMGNRVRDDHVEAAAPLGRQSAYADGQAVDPAVEATNGAGCHPLTGWKFTFGTGHEKKAPLSTVTTLTGESGPTVALAPQLDQVGTSTDRHLPGAVTVTLTDEQVKLANRRELWVQGGTPSQPVPQKGDGFGVLRCGVDGHGGSNVQWIGFPAGTQHVFCFVYYVRGAGEAGTLIVRAKPTRKIAYPQRFTFDTTATMTAAGTVSLWTSGDQVDAAFTRTAGLEHRVTARVPGGWRLVGLSCAKSGSGKSTVSTQLAAGLADVKLAAGEVVTCAYLYEPPTAPLGVTLRVYADSPPAGPFGVTVNGEGGPRVLSAAPLGDGSPATATGSGLTALVPATYTVTLSPPATEAAAWTLGGMICGDSEVRIDGLVGSFTVASAGVPIDCTLRAVRRSGRVGLRAVTVGGVGAAAFAVVPAGTGATGWSAVATTTGYGVPSVAAGAVPTSLPFGSYLVTPLAPRSTVDGSWKLTTFACGSGISAAAKGGALIVTVSADKPDAECTASYEFVAATRLHLTLRFAGEPVERAAATVVELSCVDGSAGRVVLPANDVTDRELPEPLGFLEPTKCTLERTADGDPVEEATFAMSVALEPASGNAPLSVPTTFSIARETPRYSVTVTATYRSSVDPVPKQARLFDNSRMLPVAMIGGGLIGLGIVMLLVLVIRSRSA